MSLEQEDADEMHAIHDFYDYEVWKDFFDRTEDITADVLPTGDVQVIGSRATVDIQVQLGYRDNKNRPQKENFSYIWTLENLNNQWILTNVTTR